MAANIRKFFAKRRADAKFMKAGAGHKLDSPPIKSVCSPQSSDESIPPVVPMHASESTKRAAAAAFARSETSKHQQVDMSNRSQAVIRAKALKELEDEKLQSKKDEPKVNTEPEVFEGAPLLAVNGVFFTCPLLGPDVLPKDEMKAKIREFLYEQLEEERGLTSCLIMHTCNSNREKIRIGIQTLSKYLGNIVENPTEDKYRKIRVNNKVFQERVACLEGAHDFLLAAGFVIQSISPSESEVNEDFYVFREEKMKDIQHLQVLQDALISAEPIRPQLDRNMKVLSFQTAPPTVNLPADFYNLTVDELKREQQLRKEVVQKHATFRTKAMREQDDLRELRMYRFTLLRIRFPDDVVLQGTFSVRESIGKVYEFVREHIEESSRPFVLITFMGNRMADGDSSLLDLQLVPAVVLNFIWDPEVVVKESKRKKNVRYLRADILALLQSV